VDDRITVEMVPAWTTWPLRQEVLRPRRPVRDCVYPGEDDRRSAHVAALQRAARPGTGLKGAVPTGAEFTVLAVGAVLPEAPDWEPDGDDGWRLRGMATRPDVRGQGLGTRVLDRLIDHVVDHGGGLLWCNARTPALHLYQRAGFSPRGDVFELPEIGPHQVMWRIVEPR
jgi:GNAT superfamily N-acetyltransferase